MFSIYNSTDSIEGMASAIYSWGPWSLEFVCGGPEAREDAYFYLYDTLPLKLGLCLPFSHFEQLVLNVLNITPTQLQPNNRFFQVYDGRVGSNLLVDSANDPHFPLSWTRGLAMVVKGDKASLSSWEDKLITKLFKLSPISCLDLLKKVIFLSIDYCLIHYKFNSLRTQGSKEEDSHPTFCCLSCFY
ncbi:hypothetical protein CR513_60394, partial [Mucuna pruriens]